MKYYYTDPLAAAWMAKHHGIGFNHPGGHISGSCGERVYTLEEILFHEKGAREGWQHIRFIIHPNSLHLLEVQIGDLCELDIVDNIREPKAWLIYAKLFPDYVKKVRVVHRNGIPFMWQEVGE